MRQSEQERDGSETEVSASEAQLRAAFEAMPDGLALYDSKDRLLLCNAHYRAMFDRTPLPLVPGVTLYEILHSGLENGQYPDAIGREEEWAQERYAVFRGDKANVEIALSGDRYLKALDATTAEGDRVALRVDITELKRAERGQRLLTAALEDARAQLEWHALHDPLTGLANRRFFEQAMAETPEGPFAVLHIDLDRFKRLNDRYGHAVGDAALRHVADVLRDVTTAHGFAARLGGDEFLVVLARPCDAGQARQVASAIRSGVAEPFLVDGMPYHVRASVGVACDGEGRFDGKTLLSNADVALYRAKGKGGGVAHYSRALEDEARQRERTGVALLDALDDDAIVPVYQPQVDSQTGALVGVEALARWRRWDEELGEMRLLPPVAFLDIAAELMVEERIDAAILRHALQDSARLAAAGAPWPKISVNVSARRLLDPGLEAEIDALAPAPGALSFELLESILLDDSDPRATDGPFAVVSRLRERGIGIELDDFGSGHASLIALNTLKPDRLKIDRRLVFPIVESRDARALVGSILGLADTLGIQALAEGVETQRHAAMLATLGCRQLQGYAFSRPLPFDCFAATVMKAPEAVSAPVMGASSSAA